MLLLFFREKLRRMLYLVREWPLLGADWALLEVPGVLPCSSALIEDAAGGMALAAPDVAETTLEEATAGAAVDVVGRFLLSAEAVPSWSSESESRAGPVGASFCEVCFRLYLDGEIGRGRGERW
jgi:hypothetical protein